MDNTESMRYAIYARYSSDLQRPTSIEDQIRKCEEFGRGQGWFLANGCTYTDEAISGVSTERPGLRRMLQAALSESRPFDVILIDDTSRLSRHLGDVIHLKDQLIFAGLRIIAVAQGVDTQHEQADVLIAAHGIADSLYVKEMAKKTHRGLEGAFLRGFHTGGRCYGYRTVRLEGGRTKKEVVDEEAAVVRRIFEMSASGFSQKKIASTLNSEQLPPPRPWNRNQRPTWCHTAIHEMLRRELYIGRVIWNQTQRVKVPGTNRIVKRPRPRAEWRIYEQPTLRIVSDKLWEAVQARLANFARIYGGTHKGLLNRSASSRNLLTGFLKCSLCGGNFVVVSGRGPGPAQAIYGCPQHWNRGTCSNKVRIRKMDLEKQLFSGLQLALCKPETIDCVLEEFLQQLQASHADKSSQQDSALRRKVEIQQQIERLTAAVAENGHSPSLL